MSDYVLWRVDVGRKHVTVEALHGGGDVMDAGAFARGRPMSDGFPDDAYFTVDPAAKKATIVPDSVMSLSGVPLVSSTLKALIEEAEPAETEFLPVQIRDEKGKKTLADDYWIVHPTSVVECIDLEASEVVWNKIDKTLISSCAQLVIDEDRIPEGLKLFRAKHLPGEVFVHRELAEALEGAEASGVSFLELDEYPE